MHEPSEKDHVSSMNHSNNYLFCTWNLIEIIVLTNCCSITYYSEYLSEKKHLGGLLILLPRNISTKNVEGNNDDKGEPKNVLAELEKLLMHEEVPVSYKSLRQLFLSLLVIYMFHYLYSI